MASLKDAQRAIVASLVQHISYSHRASSTVVNRINHEIDKLSKKLAEKLYSVLNDLTEGEKQSFLAGKFNTKSLKELKSEIDQHKKQLDKTIQKIWDESAIELAQYESEYIKEVLNKAVDGLKDVNTDTKGILKKAKEQPVSGGELLSGLLTGLTNDNEARIYALMRQSFADGQTNSEVIKAIRGTKALNYQDGVIHRSKIDVERVVRTARNHVGNVAYEEAYKDLGVKYVVIVATLDGRTSKYCASMDGKRYKIDESYPKPPFHPNCRTVISPSFNEDIVGNRPFVRSLKVRGGYKIGEDGERIPVQAQFRPIGKMTKAQREKTGLKVGQVNAGTNYSKWFKNQDAKFQKEWLGAKRYKLYKEGGYELNRFVDLTGREYNLEELKERDKETFKTIFGE